MGGFPKTNYEKDSASIYCGGNKYDRTLLRLSNKKEFADSPAGWENLIGFQRGQVAMLEFYKTIEKGVFKTEYTEKKSTFIASVSCVENEAEALMFINAIKTKYPDARHNCYAYSLYNAGVARKRYSDDGEPKGTAGMPILEVIDMMGLTNVCVVVTRYFGGILLGASGLTRAYSNTAALGLKVPKILTMERAKELTLKFRYDLYGRVLKVFDNYKMIKETPRFADAVTVKVIVKKDEAERFLENIRESTSGNFEVESGTEGFYNIEG